jgi:hypothetical protein
VAHEVTAELAARLLDQPVRGELDEVVGLLVVELVVVDEAEPESRRADALGEVGVVEAEAEAEELDDDVVVWLFEVSLERAAVLAPVIVVAFGAAAGVGVLWAKVGWEALRRRRRPWLVVGLGAATIALIAALSLLGVELPRE